MVVVFRILTVLYCNRKYSNDDIKHRILLQSYDIALTNIAKRTLIQPHHTPYILFTYFDYSVQYSRGSTWSCGTIHTHSAIATKQKNQKFHKNNRKFLHCNLRLMLVVISPSILLRYSAFKVGPQWQNRIIWASGSRSSVRQQWRRYIAFLYYTTRLRTVWNGEHGEPEHTEVGSSYARTLTTSARASRKRHTRTNQSDQWKSTVWRDARGDCVVAALPKSLL